MLEYLGMIAIMLSWLAGYSLLYKWRINRSMSFSKHAASAQHATFLFAVTLIGCGCLFFTWLMLWLVPELRLSYLFSALIILAFVLQIITALWPDNGGLNSRIHSTAAYTEAALFLPLGLLIIQSEIITPLVRIICISLLLVMSTISLLFLFVPRAKSQYLAFQLTYIIAFQLIIISAAYLPR